MLHQLKANPKARNHRTKRVGRGFGSGIGGRSTRGTKGQLARKSGNVRLGFEGGQTPLYMRVGKIGFNNARFARPVTTITLSQLSFYPGIKVFDWPQLLRLRLVNKRTKFVKVIGNHLVQPGLVVHAHAFSQGAKATLIANQGQAITIGS